MEGEQGAPPWPLGLFFTSRQYQIPLAESMNDVDPQLLRTITLCLAVRRAMLTDQLRRSGADWELLQWIAGDD